MRIDKAKATHFELPISFAPEEVRIYLAGSSSVAGYTTFHPELSDIDLLYVPRCRDLRDYEAHLEQSMSLSVFTERTTSRVTDVFMITESIVEPYLACFPIYWDRSLLSGSNMIFGVARGDPKQTLAPTDKARRLLYSEEALRFCEVYKRLLPDADTRKARKIAKRLLIGMKLIVCTAVSEDRLALTETSLMGAGFDKVRPFLTKTSLPPLVMDNLLQSIFEGSDVKNWPAWMRTQDKISCWLTEVESLLLRHQVSSITDRRLASGISKVYDMLSMKLKNIIGTRDEKARLQLIEEYADNAASVSAILALSGGVKTLENFSAPDTPHMVQQSYEILVGHLRSSNPTITCLAAAIVLLEYSFQQAVLQANKKFVA